MSSFRLRFVVALVLSAGLHVGWLAPWKTIAPPAPAQHLQVQIVDAPVEARKRSAPSNPSSRPRALQRKPLADTAPPPRPDKPPASLAAPPPPSAEEWQLASTYTPRNSKRYRHAWAQQVRSQMGTAVEGPEQGLARFRIEIAPDGKVTRAEELWSTSKLASRLAWQAIRNLPQLPPTPTGKPLVFEQTISFLPYETGWPPSYQLDCLPEPEVFRNPFVWDGTSAPNVVVQNHRPPPPEGCPPDSTAETIEEEEKSAQRQMDQWRWGR